MLTFSNCAIVRPELTMNSKFFPIRKYFSLGTTANLSLAFSYSVERQTWCKTGEQWILSVLTQWGFDISYYKTLTEKLKSESDEDTMRWIENWLKKRAQRVHQQMLRTKWLQSSLAEKGLGIPMDTRLKMSQWRALGQRRLRKVSLAALGGMLPAHQGTWSFSAQPRWGHTWSAGSSSEVPSTGRHGHTGDPTHLKTWRNGTRSTEPDSSQIVPSDRTRVNGHKLKHGRFPVNIRKDFFYCECN